MEKKRCIACGKQFDPSELSKQGLCVLCAMARRYDSYAQIKAKQGPYYEKWKERTIAGVITFLTNEGYEVRRLLE